MENDSFDIEAYLSKNEGLFSKFLGWLRKHLTITILSFIIAVLSLIIAVLSLNKQYKTTDAGVIVERIYQELKLDVAETQKYIQMVSLPDSLEQKEEVRELRLFQNEILKHTLMWLSVMEQIPLYVCNDTSINDIDYLKDSKDMLESLSVIIDLHKNNFERFAAFISSLQDSILVHAINFGIHEETTNNFGKLTTKHAEVLVNLEKIVTSTSNNRLQSARELFVDYFGSDELSDYLYSCRDAHLNMLNVINIRLLSIKNNSIKKY